MESGKALSIVIYDPSTNRNNQFVEEQAIDRVHRLNQTVDVVVYKITIQNTVEERILELQEKKRELANATIEGKAALKLSMKDILQLFRRDAEYMPDNAHSEGWLDKGHGRVMGGQSSTESTRDRDDDGPVRRSVLPNGSKGRVAEDSVFGRRW